MERKITAYQVIHGSLQDVIQEINRLLKIGWEPLGNVGVSTDGTAFHQAIVKKEYEGTNEVM